MIMKYLKALAVFAGTVIGVGIFGLPYVALKAGFWVVVLYFLFLTGVTITIHLMYGEVSLGYKVLHRLPGAVEKYMGRRWKNFTFLITSLGLTGALLAYLIVGGTFLTHFFSPYFGGSALIYTLFFWTLGTFFIFRGIKSISLIELLLLLVFLGILVIFSVKAFPFINVENFKSVNLKFLTLPYGVVLFSLWGINMVPEIKEILGENRQALKRTIISGILLAALTYLVFIYVILGTSGPNTSKEAISGFAYMLGDGIIRLGFLFGIITCFTSFLTLGLTLKKVFWYDFHLSSRLSWFVACFAPLLLFFAGAREFIDIVGLTGAVAVGSMGIIVVFLYREFLKKKLNRKMNPLFYALPLFFILGIAFEIFYFVVR